MTILLSSLKASNFKMGKIGCVNYACFPKSCHIANCVVLVTMNDFGGKFCSIALNKSLHSS